MACHEVTEFKSQATGFAKGYLIMHLQFINAFTAYLHWDLEKPDRKFAHKLTTVWCRVTRSRKCYAKRACCMSFSTAFVSQLQLWHLHWFVLVRSVDDLNSKKKRLSHEDAAAVVKRTMTSNRIMLFEFPRLSQYSPYVYSIIKTELILFTKRRPPNPQPLQFHNVTIPWSNTVKYLGLLLDSKLLFTKHLQTVLHKATGTFLNTLWTGDTHLRF